MAGQSVDELKQDVIRHKQLLNAAQAEISKLRDQVGHCATTIMETVMLEDSQGEEIKFLKARISELEEIVAQSEEQREAARQVFEAMRGAMDRMQESIKKVADQAKSTADAADLSQKIKELEKVVEDPKVAEPTVDIDSFLKPV